MIAGITTVYTTLTGGGAGADRPDPGLRAADLLPAGKPVPLTAEQCQAAANAVDGMRADRSRLADKLGARGLAEMDAAIADSAGWVAAGCPSDEVRGYYPNPNGPGGELRIFNQQTFSPDGVTHATMERVK